MNIFENIWAKDPGPVPEKMTKDQAQVRHRELMMKKHSIDLEIEACLRIIRADDPLALQHTPVTPQLWEYMR